MAKTIIQTIGPLYGEPVNGTVYGRPNGSIYVPSSNTVQITLGESYRYIYKVNASYWRTCDSTGTPRNGAQYNIQYVAEAQDLASNIQIQIYSDAELTTLVASRNLTAGGFNSWIRDIQSTEDVVNEQSYYLRAQLMNNGVPVATSNVIEVKGVTSE